MTLVRFSKYYFVSDVGLNQFSKHCFVPGQRPSIKYVVTELAILDPLPPSQLSFCRSFCSEHCLMPGQVRFEQEGQYIDNLQDRKLGSATSVWGQVQVYKGAVNTRVSVQGVESLWGDCRFFPAGWGSQQQICTVLLFLQTFHYKNDKKCESISIFFFENNNKFFLLHKIQTPGINMQNGRQVI